MTDDPIAPTLEWIYTAEIDVGPVRDLGPARGGHRFIVDILGGRFEGPALGGGVLAGGGAPRVAGIDSSSTFLAAVSRGRRCAGWCCPAVPTASGCGQTGGRSSTPCTSCSAMTAPCSRSAIGSVSTT